MNRRLFGAITGAVMLTTASLALSAAAPSMTHPNYAFMTGQAQAAGMEPRFRRALTNLRYARWLLRNSHEEGRVDTNVDRALAETNQAIGEVRVAIAVRGGESDDLPAPDVVRTRGDRLNAATRYLNAAYTYLNVVGEPEGPANAWRRRALAEVREATNLANAAMRVDNRVDNRVPLPIRTKNQCVWLDRAARTLHGSSQNLSEALRAFENDRGPAYYDTLNILTRTNQAARDTDVQLERRCNR
ncbi:MAG: hypothetical protein DLM53_09615 [Candidatus Eremiobacter antarcticus]|nr:hypothetical protein [Candidatus Eremiobacteraeota bacterium]MBC5807470.1 hypothetical protein [Candidatus Eremiobacteraeota bacterium]PZR61470.1 MAG: hypothetical protein DLM53_09615 [Candidatus Eremiobacter sp. RRmetagenome_bin22]